MADEEIYTIESGIAEVQTRDAYLNSYRAYRASQDVSNIAMNPLSRPTRPMAPPTSEIPEVSGHLTSETAFGTGTLTSESSFVTYRPSSYRILAIVSAIICCCPVGIAALIYSCRADSAKKAGYFSKATILGKSARDLAVVSIVFGVFIGAVVVLLAILLFIPGVAMAD